LYLLFDVIIGAERALLTRGHRNRAAAERRSDRLRMSPSLGNPYMRCGATDGLIVLAPSCSALRGSRSRAIRFPSQAQVGPVAKLHWLDRQKSRGFVRELPHDRRIDVEMLRDEFGRRVRQPVRTDRSGNFDQGFVKPREDEGYR